MKTIFVIFWVTWDLSKRKLIPALFNIFKKSKSSEIKIIWVWRKDFLNKDFLEYLKLETLEFLDQGEWFNDFLETIIYEKIEVSEIKWYKNLKIKIDFISNKNTQVIYYMSISPIFFPVVTKNFKISELNFSNSKIIFEKPFWTDLESAKQLNITISEVFSEKQVYRIDHYVWKEAIQNILTFRFANIIFEPIWNNNYIDNIQITASEEIWVEKRWSYYDNSWALKDMVQNHLFQVLSFVTMETPSEINYSSIRSEKIKIFKTLKFDQNYKKSIVFGQYDWYLYEKWVNKNSRTETFVALKLEVCNWRFSWVPIYLRTWKSLEKKSTKIVIEFKEGPDILFKKFWNIERNRIILEVQPNESISINFNIKENWNSKEVQNVSSLFSKELISKEAYEKLIEDAIIWDKTLFTSWDMLKQTWKIVDDLVNCKNNCPMLFKYKKWSSWPQEMNGLLSNDGRSWY